MVKINRSLNRHEIYKNFYGDVITVGSAFDAMELELKVGLKKAHIGKKNYRQNKIYLRVIK